MSYVIAVLILCQFFSVQLVLAFYENPNSQPASSNLAIAKISEPQTATKTPKGLPARLKIPRIHVDAVINHVGLLPDGSMGIPEHPLNAAWYKLGPKPGDTGSAVIDGHVNWWYGATGVFAHLSTVKPGDTITVQDEQGKETHFIVRESRAFGFHEDASTVFRSYDGKAHLNLITCEGVWIKSAQAYSKRLVVFADKVEK